MADWIQMHFWPLLINTTWQSGILIALIFMLTHFLANRPAVLRQALWTIAIFGSLIVPLIGIFGRSISLLEINQPDVLRELKGLKTQPTKEPDFDMPAPLQPKPLHSSDAETRLRLPPIGQRMEESTNPRIDEPTIDNRPPSHLTFHVFRITSYAKCKIYGFPHFRIFSFSYGESVSV